MIADMCRPTWIPWWRIATGVLLTIALAILAPTHDAPASEAVYVSLPPITVSSPRPHGHVRSPLLVRGTANVFEANVTLVLKDSKGRVLARRFTTATCGTGCRGSYRVYLHFRVARRQAGFLYVQDDDAAGRGFPPHRVRVPLTLLP
jgi:hypothetical protein